MRGYVYTNHRDTGNIPAHLHAMAARKFVGAFVLLVLEFETANACCIEMRNGKSNLIQSGPASIIDVHRKHREYIISIYIYIEVLR